MELKLILEGIRNWNSIKSTSDFSTIERLFGKSTGYEIYINSGRMIQDLTVNFHSYLACLDQKLFYCLIESSKDTEEQYNSKEGILPFITICELFEKPFPESDSLVIITPKEAEQLVNNWEKHKDIWIKENVSIEDGFYNALVIPKSDLKTDTNYSCFFALKQNDSPIDFTADLVLTDYQNQLVTNYYDLVRPVPPFKIGELDKSRFFLLNLALK
jgi:hypothetical protein